MRYDAIILVPTRERPENALRLVETVTATATLRTGIVFAVDDDDPSYDGADLSPATVVRGPRRDMPAWTNALAAEYAPGCEFVVSLGDDHVPHERDGPGWDEMLAGALHGRPGVAYGNDLFQGERWPTAAMIPSRVVLALGHMCLPDGVLGHLCADCFWRRLGEDLGCLEYLDDVIIEHLHPVAGKAGWDDSYMRSNAGDMYLRDNAALDTYLRDRWPEELRRLRKGLGL